MTGLDLKDKRILALLDENSRYSNTQIAKRVGLSKPAVEYRIRRLENEKAIFNYYTVVDFTRLGYSQYKLYFKFQDTTLEDEKEMIKHFVGEKNVIWVAQLRGNWDLAVSALARSNFEFGRILNLFMNKYARFILEKDVLLTEYSPIYAREYLQDAKPSEFLYGIPSKIYELDEIDNKLLKALSTDARISVIGLAEKTGLTRDIINYRMKKLMKEKIIFQFRCYPNFQNIGINLYKIILRTKNLDENFEKKLKQYTLQHKKITQLLKLIGSWDIEIEAETETEDELYSILAEIRKEFSGIIRDFDVIKITEQHKFDFYPF